MFHAHTITPITCHAPSLESCPNSPTSHIILRSISSPLFLIILPPSTPTTDHISPHLIPEPCDMLTPPLLAHAMHHHSNHAPESPHMHPPYCMHSAYFRLPFLSVETCDTHAMHGPQSLPTALPSITFHLEIPALTTDHPPYVAPSTCTTHACLSAYFQTPPHI